MMDIHVLAALPVELKEITIDHVNPTGHPFIF